MNFYRVEKPEGKFIGRFSLCVEHARAARNKGYTLILIKQNDDIECWDCLHFLNEEI